MVTVAKMMMGDSKRRIGNDVLASPRAFLIGAPIEGRERTAMIGAAEDSPQVRGTFASPAGARIPITARGSFPRPPGPSTQMRNAAKEGGAAPSAIDTEVVLTEIHGVDDPRNSGAWKLGPGVFVGAGNFDL
jgi:hypothetical protein